LKDPKAIFNPDPDPEVLTKSRSQTRTEVKLSIPLGSTTYPRPQQRVVVADIECSRKCRGEHAQRGVDDLELGLYARLLSVEADEHDARAAHLVLGHGTAVLGSNVLYVCLAVKNLKNSYIFRRL
jgi:hypothetical protein